MAYPSFPQGSRSSTDTMDGTSFDRASNGSLRGRSMWPASKRVFKIEHALTVADAADLATFYEANKAAVFEFRWSGDGQLYDVVFKSMGSTSLLAGARWRVSVELEEA